MLDARNVTAIVVTYNRLPLLKQCLAALRAQTVQGFTVLLVDNASTDGTADIIREYTERYPHIIKPILREENQYSKGISNISIFVLFCELLCPISLHLSILKWVSSVRENGSSHREFCGKEKE